ncbi:MAG TPA: hypothetical protein VK254_02985 [Candidatus Bathyarchaeia archaeon]|nr:hypothetical protein [Candidatus Bathyarchaeia archaeon]
MSIQAIGRKLCDNGLFLARDEEATRRLITYDPLTDDKSPENASASEAPAAETKPGAQTSAAADPLSDNDTNPSSFEAVLRKIGASLDDLQRDALALSHISFSANFKDANGKGYRITINEMNLSAVG